MIYEEICTYEVAKLAKEKGFDVPTAKNYRHENGTTCNAPTQSLLQRWIREEKKIDIEIYPIFIEGITREYTCCIYAPQLNKPKKFGYYNTYELVLEDALKYALENLV